MDLRIRKRGFQLLEFSTQRGGRLEHLALPSLTTRWPGRSKRRDAGCFLPPGAVMQLLAAGLLGWPLGGVPLLEASHATASVKNLLLACIERVASRTYVCMDHAVGGGAAGGERIATGAGHPRLNVRGVNVGLHF